MTRMLAFAAAAFAAMGVGCDRDAHTGPPSIAIASDVCDQCNMIISDERFASAMRVVEADGYTRGVMFDDLNCMIRYEDQNQGLTVLGRWTHDFATSQWLDVASARFVQSEDLATPMGAHVAAFAANADATETEEQIGGATVSWESLREQFTGER